jgi:glycosyltransferase involved in cell wall biosynthesis
MLALHRAAGTWRSAVDVYIALTEFARAEFIRGGLPAAKIVVKPNSVSANEGPPYSARADADYALFVGRLSPEKGLETLLEAWKAIGSALPLKIVGEGPLARRVEAEADGRAVCWLGAQPPARVAALMRGARLAVVPSVCYEGFSLVVAEAFAAGRPLIASDLGSIASLVSDGVTGVLVPPGDARALAAAVHRALAHPDEMAALGAAGHRYYQEHLTPERNYAALLEVYARAARIASASEARSR